MPPSVSWSRDWISGSLASWRVIRWPPEVDDLAHRDLPPLRLLRVGLFEEVDEKVDDAIRRRRLAVGAVRLAFEIHREVLGAGAGALLAQREVGDHGEDDGQQGERDRERDDLQSPAPQALRLVEQETQPLEARLGRRSARRDRVLQVLHQPRDLGIDAVGRRGAAGCRSRRRA